MKTRWWWLAAMSAMAITAGVGRAADELPAPATGGVGGKPIAVLFLRDEVKLDETYAKALTDAGYRLEQAAFTQVLSADYLKQFGVIIFTRLPHDGQEYAVGGHKLAPLAANLELLHTYLAAGGGMVFAPAMSEHGEAYAETYNRFLAPYGVRYLAQQLRHDAETKDCYAAGEPIAGHPITAGLKALLYPINVLRWDHAYSTCPFIAAKEWTILATGKPGAGTHTALDNSKVTEKQLTPNRDLFALRPVGKGWLAVSSIHSYYLFTHAWSKEKSLGENDTGPLQGIALRGTAERPSEWEKLLNGTLRFMGGKSAANGIGGGEVALPEQPPPPQAQAVIDWATAQPPPTWRHRVIPVWVGNVPYYDELPDPLVQGELKYFKVLVGPRTARSGGKGTVKEWRAAAQAAGYAAICFAERMEDCDPNSWPDVMRECEAASDAEFVCVPGLNVQGFQGERYLVIGARRYADPAWLTPDGKRLQAIRMLSLGWSSHLTVAHLAGRSPIHPAMIKHYQALSVYTYDGEGKLVDDSLHTYQWQVRSDSNPIPIAVHELDRPEQAAVAATKGFQQIVPAASIGPGMHYFHFGLVHYFDCPLRYFISEGPLLTGWSIRNKDLGKPEEARDRYRLGVALTSEEPLTDVTLYDGFAVAGRWTPNAPAFQTTIEGPHDQQHEYTLLATDKKGRRVLSPGIRTVTRNWRLRCGDRQNWLGSMFIYTGTPPRPFGGYSLALRNTREGGTNWLGGSSGNPAAIFDFPFFSNHVQIMDVAHETKYVDADWGDIAFDAKAPYAVRPNDFVAGHTRTLYYAPPKRRDFAVAVVETQVRLLRDVEPAAAPLLPMLQGLLGNNDTLVLPGQPPAKLAKTYDPATKKWGKGDEANRTVDLPVGAYAGGLIPLTPGLRLVERELGFPPPPAGTLNLPAGTTWTARFLVLKGDAFRWRTMQTGYDVDQFAERALTEMGFRGATPYQFALTTGKLERVGYLVELTTAGGGVAGTCRNDAKRELLYELPLLIRGLNPRVPAAVWRADRERLDYFACFEGTGYAALNADQTVEFYAGNVVTCDPALFVSVVRWDRDAARFRVNNPTAKEITGEFATVAAVRGFRALRKTITVPPGASLEVGE